MSYKPINCDPKTRIKIFFINWSVVCCVYLMFSMLALFVLSSVDSLFGTSISNLDICEKIGRFIALFAFQPLHELVGKKGSIGCEVVDCKIINLKDENKPSKIKLLVRGLIDTILPAQIFICFLRLDYRSLGDILTKTRVVYEPRDNESEKYGEMHKF